MDLAKARREDGRQRVRPRLRRRPLLRHRDPCPAGPARNDFTRALLQSRWHFVPNSATGSSPLEQCDDEATGSSTHGSWRCTKAIEDAKALLLTAQQLLTTLSIF
jgi:hypothetical protein